jgi:hypothetical protein
VFHRRPLPDGAVTAEALTASWIDAAGRQAASTPLGVRRAALRHALAFGSDEESRVAVEPARSRPVVLLAGDTPGIESPLRAAGYTVRSIRFTPFDAEAAARVQYFETYNRTAASQRVADIVDALGTDPGAILIAAGDEALAGVLASAIEPPRLAILDVGGFDTSRDGDFLEHLYIPGIRRAGDLQTASEMAPNRLVIHNAGPQFMSSGARVQRAPLTPAEILTLVRQSATDRRR